VTRGRGLIAAGVLAAALGIYLFAIDPAREATGNPSIVDFEFAWSEEGVEEIVAEWGTEGEDAARLSLIVDFAFMLAYGAFLTLAALATRTLAAARGRRRLAAAGTVAIPAAAAAPLFDAIENIWLLIALDGQGGDLPPRVAGVSASIKFGLTAIATVYVVAGLVTWARTRRAAA
jgi:hypothetical protein